MSANGNYFRRSLFEFFSELRTHNNRAWFADNKSRYVTEVEEPMLKFISALRGPIHDEISRHIVVEPKRMGGSMLRIYRDTRFSKDKTPFTPSARAIFWHDARAKDRAVPGFYLQLEPGHCMAGGGIPHPDPDSLKRIRDRIVKKPSEWDSVLAAKIPIEGESLKRPPAGYDPEHAFVEDLKRKEFLWTVTLSARDVTSPAFVATYVDACRRLAPALKFVASALGLKW